MNNTRDPSYWSPPGFDQPPYPNYHTHTCPAPHVPPPPPPTPPHHPTINANVFNPTCCGPNNGSDDGGSSEDYRIPVLEAFPWQESVKSKKLVVPPTNPSKGDRYLIYEEGAGSWNKLQNYVAWYDGYEWHYDFPLPGWILYVEDEDIFYRYNGSVWIDNNKNSTSITNLTTSNVIYVGNSETSNDFGTESDPFSSIRKALNLIVERGDNKYTSYVIKLLPGSYNETVHIEHDLLYNIYIVGSGTRNTFVGILGSTAVQSLDVSNKNLNTLSFSNLTFTGSVEIKGNEQLQDGLYLEFTTCRFNSIVALTNLYHPIFNGRCVFENDITIANCAKAEFFNDCLIQKPKTYFINIGTDTTHDTPMNWEGFTKCVFHCNVPRQFRYNLVNSALASILLYNSEYGQDHENYVIPKNVTIEGINSFFRGSVLVEGQFILSNTFVQENIVKRDDNAIIDFKNQKVSQIYDDMGVMTDNTEVINKIKESIVDVANNIQFDRRLQTLLLEPGLLHD